MPPTYRRRINTIRAATDKAGIDGLLVSYPPDQYYLTGAVLEDSAVLVTARSVVVITDSRFDEQVRLQAAWARKVLRDDGLMDAAAGVVNDLGASVRGLGVQGEHLAVGAFRKLGRKLTKARARPTQGILSAARVVKDEGEIGLIEKAVSAAEAAFRATLKTLKPGLTELEVAAELEHQMKRCGSAGPTFSFLFEPIVAVGPRASLPHARAGATRLRAGQPVLLDWGGRVGGYFSDLTRVVLLDRTANFPPLRPRERAGVKAPRSGNSGRMSFKKLGEIYRIVLEAQQAGIEAIRPGAACRDVDAAARSVIERAGYGKQFGHGLGHGIGLDIHEAPRLSRRSDEVLAAGMVVTVEPGIYLAGVGGVRIEDDVLVTPTGRRVLSRLDK